ncbi:MAG: DUF4242 domain-containing protein [Pseudomonadota bacterium]|uniref:DUF4242 domain-containing protein n=1 Tax=Fodinicurvata fenggangensis TaxID=1121830 RepID=UPI00047E4074|nr:DUF4242 domain-containing protein [Fodinicurvata fenggangensis]
MPEYVIERDIPGIGRASAEKLKDGAEASCAALREVGPGIQWVHSYVTDDKFYCIFRAQNEDQVRAHAEKAGVPADRISPVRGMLDPTAAE